MARPPSSLSDRFGAEMGRLLGPDFPSVLGLAVSGGGDSMAMLGLAVPWARRMGVALRVATIDHGLRAESGAEAALVATECATLGVEHSILRWQGWDGRGNTQDAARQARRALISDWRGEVAHVLFAHTQDDQAETFLMRLARGSGVEGLSGMAAASDTGLGWQILRPLLGATRAELRHYAKTLHIPFVDDPSNDDPRYERVRMRQALDGLAELGLSAPRLAGTAKAMAEARGALMARMREVADQIVTQPHGYLRLDRDGFAGVEADTQRRLMASALQWTAHAPYRPRLDSLAQMLDEVLAGKSATLHGCQILTSKTHLHVVRELAPLRGVRQPVGEPWDQVWHTQGAAGLSIAALGPEGLAQIARPEGVPAAALYPVPGAWRGDQLVAVPGFLSGPQSAEIPDSVEFSRLPRWCDTIQS